MKILLLLVIFYSNFEYGQTLFVTHGLELGSNCTSPDQYPGQCIEMYNCKILSRLRYKVPQLHEDRVYVTRSFCGYDNLLPLICCSPSAVYPLRALAGKPGAVRTTTDASMRKEEDSEEEDDK